MASALDSAIVFIVPAIKSSTYFPILAAVAGLNNFNPLLAVSNPLTPLEVADAILAPILNAFVANPGVNMLRRKPIPSAPSVAQNSGDTICLNSPPSSITLLLNIGKSSSFIPSLALSKACTQALSRLLEKSSKSNPLIAHSPRPYISPGILRTSVATLVAILGRMYDPFSIRL